MSNGTSLTQRKFTNDLLHDTGFLQAKPAATPLPLNCKLNHDQGELLQDPSYYRALIGKLNFLTHTRPDLSYIVQLLSQFMQSPRTSHLMALEHALRYLKGNSGQGILLQANGDLHLQAFSDSDWASCPFTRRSVTGYMLLLATLLSAESLKNSLLSPKVPLKLNIMPCPKLQLRSHGLFNSSQNLVFHILVL